MLFTALAVLAGFILGVRVGIAIGYRGERRRQAQLPPRSDSGARR